MKRAIILTGLVVGLVWSQGSLELLTNLVGPSIGFGRAVCGGVDINGNGIGDVVVGAYDEDAVYIYYGENFDDVVDLKLNGENGNWAGDYFGYALSFCPDINGDGYPELVVGAPYYSYGGMTGKVYVYYGGPTIDEIPDLVFTSPTGQPEQFGYSIACGGCSSTSPDIAIGAPNYNDGSYTVGRVYLFVDPITSPDTLVFQGQPSWGYEYFGWSISIGQMDGNNPYDELLVGSPFSDYYAGRAFLYYGGQPMDTTPDLIWYGAPGSTECLGYSVASLGDISGDLLGDFAIGIPYRSAGAIYDGECYIVLGKSPPDTTPDYKIHGSKTDYEYFGTSVNTALDMNNDGIRDFGVGATNWNNGIGRVYLFITPFDTIYDAYANNPGNWGTNYGISLSGCGDLNNDGLGDMSVGSDGQNTAYIYKGKSDFILPVFDSVTVISDTTFTGPFLISAIIYDPNGTITTDSIYYNINNSGYVSATYDSSIGDKYFFHIPQQPPPTNMPTNIKWYLMAYDGSNLAYSPHLGPDSSYQFNILDLNPPVITNVTLWPDTNYIGPYRITCNATDDAGIGYVKLYYHTSDGQTGYLPMFPTGIPNQYSASIPVQNTGKLIAYRIEAADGFQPPNIGYKPEDPPTGYAFANGPIPFKILLVDADNGDSIEFYYKKVLDSLGYSYLYWPDSWGKPRYAFENPNIFKVIIWFTSLSVSKILIQEDMDSLVSFFNRGGRLFISSQNLGEDIGNTPFYQNYLHAQFLNPAFNVPFAHAVPGDSISDLEKDTIALGGAGGANNAISKDRIRPDSLADSIYVVNDSGGCYAIKYKDPDPNGYRLVYFSVPFEAIDANPYIYAQQGMIMASILKWFGMIPGIAEDGKMERGLKFSLGPLMPNPTTGQVNIQYTIGNTEEVSLKVYDPTGRLVKTLIKGEAKSGIHHLQWNGTDSQKRRVSSGVYFLILENSKGVLKEKVVITR